MSKAAQWVRSRFAALLIWAFFSIGGTILPILAVFFLVRIAGNIPTQELLFGEGQALLIASAISADALGRIVSALWSKRTSFGIFQLVLLLVCFGVIVVTAVEFQSILSAKSNNVHMDLNYILDQSKAYVIGSLLAGFGAIMVLGE
jgi:hypothetical protein